MSRIFNFTLLAATAAMVVACAGIKDTSGDAEAIVEQIRQADLALLQAEEQRDLDGVMVLIAPNAVFQPPGYLPIVGHEAIREFYETQWFELPFIEISGEPETIVVSSSGDLAYFDGRSHLVLEVSGERKVSAGKYLAVWQKVSGDWKLAAISWSANEVTR